MPVDPRSNTHFPMAYLAHGAGFVPQQPPSDPSYTHAVFRAFDDASSRAASHDSRDSPAHPFNNPFNNPSQSHVRPLTFADARPYAVAPQVPIHPTTLEMAEGLIRMRSSVEPMSAMLRDPPAHEIPIATAAGPVTTTTTHPPLPKKEPESQITGPADPSLPRHPVSTSSEDNVGRNSDDFSLAESSDTITDPDVDIAEAAIPKASGQAAHSPGFQVPEAITTAAEQSGANSNFTRSSFPVGHVPNQGSSEMLDRGVANPQGAEANHQKLYDPAAPIIIPAPVIRCCCRDVADVFINILDEKEPADTRMLTKLYGMCSDGLCSLHMESYAKLVTKAIEYSPILPPTCGSEGAMAEQDATDETAWEIDFSVTRTGTGTKWAPGPRRRRRTTSMPGIDEYEFDQPPKRRKVVPQRSSSSRIAFTNRTALGMTQSRTPSPAPQSSQGSSRPLLDVGFNESFRRRILAELNHNFTDLKEDDWSRGETTNRYIHAILSKCKPPNTDIRRGPIDAGFLSGEEAATVIEKGGERLPLVTEGQQQFQWNDSRRRPIAQLFHRMEDLSREVSVQIPSHNFDLPSYETKSLQDIRDRFLAGYASPDPWNILDLRSPLPPAILPKFLVGENCQLLPRIRDALLEGRSAERTKATREEWNEWTELLEWVLMSEGGHNTAPHMDSHGWSTWITIQEGHFGFGWLSRPTEKEQDAWMNDPLGYTGGKWRFVILKPGQTVFFPSGTIHFVFRLQEEQTLALGGHVLQWTALDRWVQIILYQLKNPNITNEDLGTAPLKYIRTARKLVEDRIKISRLGSMGGMPVVTMFMFLSNVGQPLLLFCPLLSSCSSSFPYLPGTWSPIANIPKQEVERWYNKKKKKRAR